MYLDNDMVLGKLFIKVIERKMDEITFEKIYNFIHCASIELNEKENTTILVSREGIINFAELYKDFIQIDEEEKKIIITHREESLFCFQNRYEDNGKDYAESFDFALKQIAA